MLRRLALLLAVLSAVALFASPSFAGQATTETQHFKNLVESDVVSDCNGNGPYTETFVSSGVMHTTQLADGTFHFTVTAQGTDTLVPSDPALPTFSGHFVFWDGDNLTKKTDISTFTQSEILRGTDGSTLHFNIVLHSAEGPNGPIVDFAQANCFHG